ncbi:hypothetical protein AB0H76_09375 [Nocardia sp. NPDC050712]|uniref:hypothetical protein n=1 Tax=Nocardia sp. NPDC050712 TaxID=3155518 RepID=UPI0034046E0E
MLAGYPNCGSNLGWSEQIRNIALPERDRASALTSAQESHVLEVLFGLLDEFLGVREGTELVAGKPLRLDAATDSNGVAQLHER